MIPKFVWACGEFEVEVDSLYRDSLLHTSNAILTLTLDNDPLVKSSS